MEFFTRIIEYLYLPLGFFLTATPDLKKNSPPVFYILHTRASINHQNLFSSRENY